MVRVSTEAVQFLEESRRTQGVPESYGVRIFGEDDGQGGLNIRLAFADEPAEKDRVLEQAGTEFYVAEEVTTPLADSVIDITEEQPTKLFLRSAMAE